IAPTGSFSGLPASLSGTVTLTVWTAGGASRVTFEERPVGGTTRTQIAADTTAPYTAAFDTRLVADGRYDLRATTSDALGNSSTDVRPGLLVDNTAPAVVSSTPADGSVVASAGTIALTATEDLSDVTDVQLDGAPLAAPPVVNGPNATFATGALAVGLHTLGGRLVDFGGQSSSFRISVTVWTPGAGEAPPVARSTTPDAPTVLTTPDAMATVTFPAGAYSGGTDNFLVLRLDMGTPVSLVPAGLIPGARVIDVRAVWASNGTELHDFLVPLQISMVDPSGGSAIAATYESGAWRMIPEIPGGTTLPDGWRDGFYRDSAGVHILTKHLTLFTLMRDIEAPPPPTDFAGVVADDGLTLRWAPGRDNSGLLDNFTLFVDGSPYADYDLTQVEAKMGAFAADDTREFSIVETDLAGNVSPPAGPLLAVPTVAGKTLADAKAALAARGFAVGKVTEVVASAPAGTVVAPAGVQLRLKGAAVDLQVSVQTVPRNAQFVFQVSKPTHSRVAPKTIVSRIRTAKAARVTATLYGPNRLRFVQRWSFSVKAGTTTKRLRLRRPTVHGGVYELVWSARTATGETLRYRQRMRIYSPLPKR
ncbi:MAG TPA: PASTA domain-containing protein, partial [Gaiellaceae bacterium]